MKFSKVKDNAYIDSVKEVNNKDSKFKVGEDDRTFLLKDIFVIDLKKFLWLKKLKIQFHGHMLSVILMAKKLLEHFIKINCKKKTNKNLE